MSLRINQNVLSIRTQSSLTQTTERLDRSIQKLSTGLRINTAADDAAGLAISEKLRRQIRGLNRAVLNAQDGISMIQSAEGALNESQANLQRMRELAIQATNDTLTTNDRLEIQKEINQLKQDLDRIAHNTDFNTKKLLDGSQSGLISINTNSAKGIVTDLVAGGDYAVSLLLLKSGASEMLRSQIFTKKETGAVADGQTQLVSITQFYDANGTFLLENPTSINVSGNGHSVDIKLDSGSTLGYLNASIGQAVQTSGGLDMANATVNLITTGSTSIAGKGGYFEVTSGLIGDDGHIAFSGEQAIIQALGISTVREASNNLVQGTTYDEATTNMLIIQTNDSRATGLINGVDIKFKGQAGQVAGTSGIQEGLYVAAGANCNFNISSIGGAGSGLSVAVTIGSGNWSLQGIVGAINSAIEGAGVSGLMASLVDGQIRLTYVAPTVSLTDSFVISGATGDVIGFTDGLYNTFTTGVKNTTAAVFGFTRYDSTVAATAITHSVTDGAGVGVTINAYTTTSVYNGVLNGDMKTFAEYQTSANTTLINAGALARVDMIGGNTVAWTSTLIGKRTSDTGVVTSSTVTLTIADGGAGTTQMYTMFGFSTASLTKNGAGDSTMRLHVVDNTPQFQIGADQGQTMKVAMTDMSSEGLGVENIDMSSISGANKAMGKISRALDHVSSERSKFGAYQNRLEYAINNLRSMSTNASAAESRIRDVDVAQEMIEFTRDQIINQSGMAMLAQANLLPQGILTLLK